MSLVWTGATVLVAVIVGATIKMQLGECITVFDCTEPEFDVEIGYGCGLCVIGIILSAMSALLHRKAANMSKAKVLRKAGAVQAQSASAVSPSLPSAQGLGEHDRHHDGGAFKLQNDGAIAHGQAPNQLQVVSLQQQLVGSAPPAEPDHAVHVEIVPVPESIQSHHDDPEHTVMLPPGAVYEYNYTMDHDELANPVKV